MKSASKKKILKTILLTILFSVILISLFSFSLFFWYYTNTPLNLDKVTSNSIGVTVYDINNNVVETNKNGQKNILSFDASPVYIKDAFIAIEDKNFQKHNGIQPHRMLKAFLVNFKRKNKVQGASTITQQLIKNTMLTNEKTYNRKLKEIVLAIKLENKLSKNEILENYLNSIYFGENCYGIENAANYYFNCSTNELTLSQAATLAGIINLPNYYSPIYNPSATIKRRNFVLKMMLENKKITKSEYDKALDEQLTLTTTTKNYLNSYNHLALKEACNILNMIEKDFIKNQYKIYTYQDSNIQSILESNLSQNKYNDINALQIVSNNENNTICAYQGNSNFDLSNIKRQPASLVKPIIIYLPAVEENIISPATAILDEPINYEGYAPQNSSKTFTGWTNIRHSLEKSLNIPAIKVLSFLGIEKSLNYAKQLDLDVSIENDNNYALALGSITNGASLNQLMDAYIMLAKGGSFSKSTMIKKITTHDDITVYEHSQSSKQLFSNESCYLITDMLKPNANSTTTGILKSNFDIASKTGTSSLNGKPSDFWNIAYTSSHTIGSWLGTTDSTQTFPKGFSSSKVATELTKNIIDKLYENKPPANFKVPENIIKAKISKTERDINHLLHLAQQDEEYITEIFKANNIPQPKQKPEIENPQTEPVIPKKTKKKWWYI